MLFFVSFVKMTKTIKKLEKETMMWKQKWEKSNQSLVELSGDVSIFTQAERGLSFIKVFS